ncbi:MAG: OmpA family protein [Roseobacter sp.]
MTFATILCAMLFGLVASGMSQASVLDMPANARETATRNTGPDSYSVPVAAFDGVGVPTKPFEGNIARQAWRIPTGGLTTLQVIQPLRAQLEGLGYDIVFECDEETCGGFDFRFGIEVLPGPNMYVNIGRFRFLTATRGTPDALDDVVTLLASTTTASAYVQIVHGETVGQIRRPPSVTPQNRGPDAEPLLPVPVGDASTAQFLASLEQLGHVALTDLPFETGSTDLVEAEFQSLRILAEILELQPTWRIAFVGHTDTVGGLAPNISVSRARAQSVRARMIREYGIAADRLDAEGMGYLAPIASNLSANGRTQNRRVEAVLLNTE